MLNLASFYCDYRNPTTHLNYSNLILDNIYFTDVPSKFWNRIYARQGSLLLCQIKLLCLPPTPFTGPPNAITKTHNCTLDTHRVILRPVSLTTCRRSWLKYCENSCSIFILLISSGYYFAHVRTSELSSHVQNCDMIRLSFSCNCYTYLTRFGLWAQKLTRNGSLVAAFYLDLSRKTVQL